MAIIIWCRRSASAPPLLKSSFTPQGKRSISPHVGLFYYLGSPELIPPPYKIAHPSSIPSRSFGGHCTHDGGLSLLPDPPHRSFSNRTHSFFSVHFFPQPSCGPPILWLTTFVSIVVRLESVLLPVARMPPFLFLLFNPPFCPSFRPAGVLLGSGCLENGLRMW
jgi:hypothetical protein